MSHHPGPEPDPHDPYSRLDYRQVIAWPERIRRESPFLEAVVARGPDRSILDLGCGTGEHSRFLAGLGNRVLGIDASAAQIAAARDQPSTPNLRFEVGDMTELPDQAPDRFGTALCLGNTLVHLLDDAALATACAGVHDRLLPGGVWLAQILNYERIFAREVRALPVNVREVEGAEIVFLRLLRPLPGGRVLFVPTTLRLRPEADPPIEIVSSRVITHRGWTRAEIEPALGAAGFVAVEWYGDMGGGPFDPSTANDLVFVARRD